MELTCILSVFVGIVVFAVQTHALIWEADMPNLLKQCYEEHTHDLTSELPGQDVHTYCLGKYIWQIPNVQGKFNMTENEICVSRFPTKFTQCEAAQKTSQPGPTKGASSPQRRRKAEFLQRS